MQTTDVNARHSAASDDGMNVGRLALSAVLFVILLAALWWGFDVLRTSQRDNSMPKILTGVFAIVWGVGGAAAIFFTANFVVEQLPLTARRLLTPFVFVGPAVLLHGGLLDRRVSSSPWHGPRPGILWHPR